MALSDDARNHPGPFDVETIEQLIELMSKHDLSEIDLRAGEQRICLRRGVAVPTVTPSASTSSTSALVSSPPPKPAEPPPAQPAPARQLIDIKSPAVGTFYAQEKPGAPPYVTIGARVTPTTVVCQIEAMKIFNEITADCSGVVREILVKDKEFVEYGTVLFRVDPNA